MNNGVALTGNSAAHDANPASQFMISESAVLAFTNLPACPSEIGRAVDLIGSKLNFMSGKSTLSKFTDFNLLEYEILLILVIPSASSGVSEIKIG